MIPSEKDKITKDDFKIGTIETKEEEKIELLKLLEESTDIFAKNNKQLGICTNIKHFIDIP